jgi:hypothetical protein
MNVDGVDNSVFPHAASVIDLWREAGREVSFTISGTSMEPLLKAGDRVTVHPVHPDQLRRGDLVAFAGERRVIIHRVVRRRKAGSGWLYCQKGDNCTGWSWLPERAVLGRVVSIGGAGEAADMAGAPWKWLHPALGAWAAAWVILEDILRGMKAATVGNKQAKYLPVPEKMMGKVFFLLPGLLSRLVRAKVERNGLRSVRDEVADGGCTHGSGRMNMNVAKASPETRFLVLLARLELTAEDRASVEMILRDGLDWSKVTSDAERLGAGALLYRHLSTGWNRGHVPDEVIQTLQKAYRLQAARNMAIHGRLRKILKAMNGGDIPVILLKGASLATQLYRDPALRPMSDIDLLCRTGDLPGARDLLIGLGYGQHPPYLYQSTVHERVMAPGDCRHPPAFARSGTVTVEVHSHLFGAGRGQDFFSQAMWQKSTEHVTDGVRYRALCPEHQLLHLCAHLAEHMDGKGVVTLYWLCDIHEMIRKHGGALDWKALLDGAENLGLTDPVRSVLLLVKRHWQSPVPIPLDAPVMRDLFTALQAGRTGSHRYYRYARLVKEIDNWRDRFLFLWGFMFPSRAHMESRYKPRNSLGLFLYYALHPLILVKGTFERLWRSIFRGPKRCF